jgi:hypothetical protein
MHLITNYPQPPPRRNIGDIMRFPFPYDAGHVKLEGMRTYAGVDD